MKSDINRLISDALQFQAERVTPTTPDLIATFRREDEVIDSLRRIYRLSRRLATLIIPDELAAKEA
jgi:phosphate:Na+ symporter